MYKPNMVKMCFKNTKRLLFYVTLIKFGVQHDSPPYLFLPLQMQFELHYRNFMWEISMH